MQDLVVEDKLSRTLNSFSDSYIKNWFRKFDPTWLSIFVLSMKVVERHHYYSPMSSIIKKRLTTPLFHVVIKRLFTMEIISEEEMKNIEIEFSGYSDKLKLQFVDLFVEIANNHTFLNSRYRKHKTLFPCMTTE